jgi:hypothetical protein
VVKSELEEVRKHDDMRELGDIWECPKSKVEAAYSVAAEDVKWEEQGRISGDQSRSARAVDEDEVFDALLGEEAGPLALLHVGVKHHRPTREVYGVEWSRVSVEDAVDGCVWCREMGGFREVSVGEYQLHRAPEMAPVKGERGCAYRVLDGEEGDDYPTEGVGEGADAVLTVAGGAGHVGREGGGHRDDVVRWQGFGDEIHDLTPVHGDPIPVERGAEGGGERRVLRERRVCFLEREGSRTDS